MTTVQQPEAIEAPWVPSPEDIRASREAAYQRHVETHANYVQAIRDAGDLPWWEDTEKLDKLERRLPGISSSPGEPARRRVFFARYGEEL